MTNTIHDFDAGDRVRIASQVSEIEHSGRFGTVRSVNALADLVRVELDGDDDQTLWYPSELETPPLADPTPSFEQALDSALAEVRELMVSRHAKYGPGNIARHGELGLLVRLGDKYERLDNNREDLVDESVDDTVDDIIGYGVIWKMWRKGQWPGQKPTAE